MLIHEVMDYKEFIGEPICITNERADFLLLKINSIFKELEGMKQRDKEKNAPSFYNWLEER